MSELAKAVLKYDAAMKVVQSGNEQFEGETIPQLYNRIVRLAQRSKDTSTGKPADDMLKNGEFEEILWYNLVAASEDPYKALACMRNKIADPNLITREQRDEIKHRIMNAIVGESPNWDPKERSKPPSTGLHAPVTCVECDGVTAAICPRCKQRVCVGYGVLGRKDCSAKHDARCK